MLDDLVEACRRNDLKRVQSLVSADPTLLVRHVATGETPLLAALYHRSGESLSWLMEQDWPRTIFEAAAVDDVERMRVLLAENPAAADTYSVDGWTPLHLAAFFGSLSTARLLLAHGADHRRISRNSMANTPLHAALAAKRLSLVELLLESGADPTLECNGYTPIAIAEGGNFEEGAALIRGALSRQSAVSP